MKFMKSILVYGIFLFLVLPPRGFAFQSKTEYTLSGQTMGTFYTIKFLAGKNEDLGSLQTRVDMCLRDINKTFSMFDPESRLSLFNWQEMGAEMKVPSDFYAVLSTGQRLYQITHGAWDGTVKPLVDLWGFGTKKTENRIPGPEEIRLALSRTGFHHIRFLENHTLAKDADLTLDLSSIAKGYGVDALASLFRASGIGDVLVEIGGELYAAGTNKKGEPWSVGISRPDKDNSKQDLYQIVRLSNQAIATSGNYRNFFEMNGKTYSHIINPKTGFPVDHHIVSASVIAKDCTFADGLATALMVMPVEEGLNLVNGLEGTECLIVEKKEGILESHMSEHFHRFLAQ
ncbi:MAG: FAD:protein FMN transferase [Desulfobacteraceae bacterium]|nr:FAD:protein FMN transferase [Desulfobacteraceae bacterium]